MVRYILMFLLMCGCTISGSGEVSEEDRNKIMVCTDTRDGEVFKFNSNTIKNIRIGIGTPSSYDITTTEGKHKTLNKDMEAWLKCLEE